ncbi:MAG: excinuclease ABC subunit UvrC [Moraxellaceae bacterium]|nr:excinuclease ABC subunit UvrC [Moraxellaceae bacterium]
MSSEGAPTERRITEILATLPSLPGIYHMLGQEGDVLYVGKARNLKNRVSSYFQKNIPSPKTRALVARICDIRITITSSETEALLLEQTLIKELKPPYNILLRDDKSYPYIFMAEADVYPRIGFHRGTKKEKGRYFGPYPGSHAVRESLQLLQKLFQVRQCEDSFFRNRERPCLQYQIKRCRAPCVGLVSPEDYAADVRHTVLFLEGKNEDVMTDLVARMETASEKLDFEQAVVYRDQLTALRRVQEQQFVSRDAGNADVFAVAAQPGGVCVQVLFVREGRVLGSNAFHPKMFGETSPADILDEFLPSFYLQAGSSREIPDEIVLETEIPGQDVLREAIRELHGRDVRIKHRVKETRQAWLQLAKLNAAQGLAAELANRGNMLSRFTMLQKVLGREQPISRMECFDISHTMGEATVASCVVFDEGGPRKSDYRKFNIEDITPGDDYAAMHQALIRRYRRLQKGEGALPDILFIDGGKGQLAQAREVLAELDVEGVQLIGIAKGEGRKPGLETLHFDDGADLQLTADSPALHLIQHIRDEAHRFAITGHRARRGKQRQHSALEDIPGVGPKKRRELIQHFGGLQEVGRASVKDLATVPGISIRLAEAIYAALHSH